MSESIEIKKAKIDALVSGFTTSGFKSGDQLGQAELLQFLNRRSSSGRFDSVISSKLFQVLSLDATSALTVEEFINGFLQFEEEVRKNAEMLAIKFAKEEEIYAQLSEECRKYKEEKLNEEGLCDESKVSGEITEIDIKKKLEGIKEIIIKVVFNDKSEELHFKIGDLQNSNEMANKTFEFKPSSRKDHFEFIMKGINERNQVFDIGSKVFPLTDVYSQEEYLVQIVVPEIENEEQIAAYIKAKIVLFWNDYKLYEKQKKKAENRLKKLTIAKNKAEDYLRKIIEIYGDLTKKKPDLIVDFNNEKLMQRKSARLSVNFNNVKQTGKAEGNYVVEFNNQKEVEVKEVVKKEIEVKKETEVKTKEIEEKEEPLIEPEKPEVELNEEINVQQTEINVTPDVEVLNQDYNINEQVNYDQTNYEQTNYEQLNYEQNNYDTANYDQYQTQGYDQVDLSQLQNTETIKETEIRNSVNEAVIRQSLNKTLYSENVLPVIRREKVNKVIYDSDVKTLPMIFGQKKVTYLSSTESQNYNLPTTVQQEITGENYNSQVYQGSENNYQNILGQDYNQLNQGEVAVNEAQEFSQSGQFQEYSQTAQLQDYSQTGQFQDFTQIAQNQDYSQLNPQSNITFGEYQRTEY